MRSMRKYIVALLLLLVLVLPARPAYAWPSYEDVLNTVASYIGLSPEQVVAVKFAIKHPSCAATIVSYTASQDYALVGFIGALKISKMSDLAGVPPMNAGTCKSYQPVQQAYKFVDSMGDDLLGKEKANFFRKLLAEQISQGKSQVDSQIAAIPYVGTIIGNWDCGCDAAFETNFPTEALVKDKVKAVIGIITDVKNTNFGSALEKMIVALGPDIACKLGLEYTGAGSIPIVSDIAASVCSSIAGKVVEFVINAASAIGEALGFIGGEHIPPEQYYKGNFSTYIGVADYQTRADLLYKICYQYFEPTNMSASTAKKACGVLRQRYLDESAGKIQWNQFQDERTSYSKANVDPKAAEGAMMSDDKFETVKQGVYDSCVSYFKGKYPMMTYYATNYDAPPPAEEYCSGLIAVYTTVNLSWHTMDMMRAKAQNNLFYKMSAELQPLCKKGKNNEFICSEGAAYSKCSAALSNICVESFNTYAQKQGGGMQYPCCTVTQEKNVGIDKFYIDAAKAAAKYADPYCFTNDTDPLRVTCTLKQAYDTVLKHTGGDCEKTAKNSYGMVSSICTAFEPLKIDMVPGVTKVKQFVADLKSISKGTCYVGGSYITLSYDKRVAQCSPKGLEVCKQTLGSADCKKRPSGYVDATCCEAAPFASDEEPQEKETFDPSKRDADKLAATKKVVDSSNGDCKFVDGPNKQPDPYHVMCKSTANIQMCMSTLGRDATTPCKYKMSKEGWAGAPCCERDPSVFDIDIKETIAGGAGKAQGKIEISQKDLQKVKDNRTKIQKLSAEKIKSLDEEAKSYFGDKVFDADKATKGLKDIDKQPKEEDKKPGLGSTSGLTDKPLDTDVATKNIGKGLVVESQKPKRQGSQSKIPGLVSIKLISVQSDSSSVNPFSVTDIEKRVDPKAPSRSTATTSPATSPAVAPTYTRTASPTPTQVDPATGAAAPATAPSFCAGKANGNYCGSGANANTLYSCVSGAITSQQQCGSCFNNHCGKD